MGGIKQCYPVCYVSSLNYGMRHVPDAFVDDDGNPLLLTYTVRIPGRGNEGFDRFEFDSIEQAVVYIRGVVPDEIECWIEIDEKGRN